MDLGNHTVLLTGVTGNIGAAYLAALTAAGANVIAVDLPALAAEGSRLP